MDKERDASWNSVHSVHPGEVFPLFFPARNGTTIRYSDDGQFGGMASRIRLQRGLLDPLNLSIVLAPYALQRAAVITPFDRKLGYPLDQEDFSLRRRYRKIGGMQRELAAIVEGLGLVVFTASEDLPSYSKMRACQHDGSTMIPPEIASVLQHVFLTLSFPDGSSFTARATGASSRLVLTFHTFFPTDTGPLPTDDSVPNELHPLSVEEGFRILLPFDAERVQMVHAKFLLLPDAH